MRIGWLSIGNDNFGSTRIGVTNIHKTLNKIGIYSHILNYNKIFQIDFERDMDAVKKEIADHKLDLIVFHKIFGDKTLKLVDFCKQNDIKVVFANGDWSDNPMYNLADGVIVGSSYVREYLINNYNVKKCVAIDDGLETLEYPIKKTSDNKDNINLGWFGNFTKLQYVYDFYKKIKNSNFNLITISNAPNKYTNLKADLCMGAESSKPWDVGELVNKINKDIDIIIVPLDLENDSIIKHYAKTANRVTFAMSLGVPVVASPIPAYREVIQNKVNGFICESIKDWNNSLDFLKSPLNREKIGKHSLDSIRNRYSLKSISEDYLNFFREIIE